MPVDVFLIINLLALIHLNAALPARLPRPGRAPRTSCVIPEPRLPKLHSCLPTDPDSIRLPSSVLTAPLGLLYSAVVPKGAFSIRDQHKPPNPLVSTLGSNWRRAQARWLNANHQAEASGQAPILSMVLHSNVSPGVHPHRDQPSCHKPRLDKMVSAGAPHWRGAQAQAQWLYKCDSRLLLMILITPSDVSLGVHPHRDLYPLVTNPVSTRWSQPGVFSGAVLMPSDSLSALTQSLLRLVILMVSSVVQHSLV